MTALRVGAGKSEIKIPQAYLAVENFRSIHDPIHARAIVIEQEKQVVIVSLELTSMPEREINEIRKLISKESGINRENIWVCVTHSFSSPHLLPDFILRTEETILLKGEYRKALQCAAFEAAMEAIHKLQPAAMGTRTGFCDIVASRDVEFEDGWWVGTNGSGLTDRTVSVLRFDDMDGKPIALLTHFGMQSSVMDQSECSDGGKLVTSDVVGNACTKVEQAYGNGMVTLFLIGAAGDQAPIEKAVKETFENGKRVRSDLHEKGFEICERLSDILKNNICTIADEIVCDQDASPIMQYSAKVTVPAQRMDRDLHSLTPTHKFTYVPNGECETVIEGIRLGDTALLGVRPELNCTTAISMIGMSDFKLTLICTLVNGASKYMADAASYERFCYEAMNSPFGRGAAELLSKQGIEVLRHLKGENRTNIYL